MIGKTLAHYEVTALLGKGGMGEVYRARDTKLGRDVALKILPTDLSLDAERLARFRREAKVLASLNHTNIASIYGLEEDKGTVFLVLELAEGEDLAHRIDGGALRMEDVLSVAKQLAHGLEQAHERGVVHRDLKPANVKLSDDGVVKILDFGLARAYAGETAQEGQLGDSPTITAAMTAAGTILGTAAYMSPEQARGMDVDRRTDIWAFGVILYEMLTGTRLFEGETVSDTLAEVLKTDPDLETLPAETPVGLRWLVERCLQKRPSKRLRDIGEARILLESDLDEIPGSIASSGRVVVIQRPRWVLPALAAVGLIALGIGFGAAVWTRPASEGPAPVQATLLPPTGAALNMGGGTHLAISPDGSRVAFVAQDTTGVEQIWVRRIDSRTAAALSGTIGASYPFWSPNGEKICFFANGALKKIDATGGVAVSICEAPEGRGGSWTADGQILFAPDVRSEIRIVSSEGGEARSLTELDSLHSSHRWPVVLPDQKHFVYIRLGRTDELRWRSMEDASVEISLLSGVQRAAFGDGHLFLGRDGALWARPFDPTTGRFLGEEKLVVESVITSVNYGSGAYSISDDGTMVYAVGSSAEDSWMATFNENGELLERIEFDDAWAEDPNLSPDGRYLAVALWPVDNDSPGDIWIRDLQRRTLTRLTRSEGADDPVWGPDGDRIVYSRAGHLFARSVRGAREVLFDVDVEGDAIPSDWSQDGKYVLISTTTEDTRSIWVVPVDDPTEHYALVENEYFNAQAVFSPDGRWIAYMSNESGIPQVYVRNFELGGGTWTVSPSQGTQPRWTESGDEIFFATEDGISAVPVRFTESGPEFGDVRRVFRARMLSGRTNTHRYDLSRDGSVFVIQLDSQPPGSMGTPLELMVGWRQIVGQR